jgi:hypothetical protein
MCQTHLAGDKLLSTEPVPRAGRRRDPSAGQTAEGIDGLPHSRCSGLSRGTLGWISSSPNQFGMTRIRCGDAALAHEHRHALPSHYIGMSRP